MLDAIDHTIDPGRFPGRPDAGRAREEVLSHTVPHDGSGEC